MLSPSLSQKIFLLSYTSFSQGAMSRNIPLVTLLVPGVIRTGMVTI